MAKALADQPIVLRVATVWGTTVLAVRQLRQGQSFALGDGPDCATVRPDGVQAAERPVRAMGSGWEIDARGAEGGLVRLRGRDEDPVRMGAAPIPVVLGDWGLLQYGAFSIFFQVSEGPPALAGRSRRDALILFAWLSSAVLHAGLFGLVRALTTPTPLPKPSELSNAEEIAARFGLRRTFIEEAPKATSDDNQASSGGPAHNGPQKSAARKPAEAEGSLGRHADRGHASAPDEPRRGLGGVSDVLAGDTGEEIKHALGTINSVAAALGGLNAHTLVLGAGSGLGLKGSGSGGGGTMPGVPFGSGTLDTGWASGHGGVGVGGGFGGVGNGRGGGATGAGAGRTGPSERQIAVASGTGSGSGGLSQEQIRRVVMAHLGALRACYESEAERNPNLRGGVTVEWQIAPEGTVNSASLGGSSLGSARVEGCVVRQVKAWRFPSSAALSRVSWPFKFGLTGGG